MILLISLFCMPTLFKHIDNLISVSTQLSRLYNFILFLRASEFILAQKMVTITRPTIYNQIRNLDYPPLNPPVQEWLHVQSHHRQGKHWHHHLVMLFWVPANVTNTQTDRLTQRWNYRLNPPSWPFSEKPCQPLSNYLMEPKPPVWITFKRKKFSGKKYTIFLNKKLSILL